MRTPRYCLILLLLAVCAVAGVQLPAQSSKHLPPVFRQWIDEDVPYIITHDERREFLRLQTDDERDAFIKQFWESRNPEPQSPVNTFKEEHYRRLAYVRDHFGDARYNDGWRTDMGRVYITLGPPQQTAKHHQGIATRPVEIWFYQSPTPALPPYFNLVFYKPSETEPYQLYSPRQDGPTKIVTNDVHEDASALTVIKKSMGSEAAQSIVSLLPGEPVDFKNPTYSSLSDTLLDEIRSLPELKLEKDRIARQRAANRENVTVNFFTGVHAAELQTVVLRDDKGLSTVDYILRNQRPDGSLIGTLPDKKTGYSMTLTTRVMTDSGKAIYERKEQLAGVVSPVGAAAGREKAFAAEGRLPLVPGNYSLESVLTNNITRNSTRTLGKVSVPAPQPDNVAVSGLMVYRDSPIQGGGAQLPFTLAGLRFSPRGEQTVEIHAGEKLPLAYQIWLPTRDYASATPAVGGTPKTVHIHYILGRVTEAVGTKNRVDEDEDVEVKNFDAAGNLANGHMLDTTSLPGGTYRLVVTVTEPGSSHAAYASMAVKIVPSEIPVAMWSAYSSQQQHPLWQDDLLRGLAAEAQGDKAEAAACYRRVLATHPDVTDAQDHLKAVSKLLDQHDPVGK